MFLLPFRLFRPIPSKNQHFIRSLGQEIVSFHLPNSQDRRIKQSVCLNRAAFHTAQWHMKTVPFLLADIGEGIREVVVREWYVKEGQVIKQFDNVCEVQSDKASVTITCRYDGIVQKVYYDVEDTAIVGQPLLDVEVEKEVNGSVGAEVQEGEAIAVGRTEEDDGIGSINLPESNLKVLTTPAVRRLAKENKIHLSDVSGTGKDGRIMKEDLLLHIENLSKPKEKAEEQSKPISITHLKTATAAKPTIIVKDTIVPVKGYMKTMVKTMTASLNIPSFMFCDEVSMTNLINLKSELSSEFDKAQLKFSYMPFFLKAASIALDSFPVLNSCLDANCENIIYKSSHNIGIAMDTSVGLVVPNIKNVQSLTILEIMAELIRLQKSGKTGSFSTQDVTGGTFTISNVGSIGGTYTQPRILVPEVAIVGLGKIQRLPRFSSTGAVVEDNIMNISWSADHRIIDGGALARFSNVWKKCLENPSNMLLYMK